MLHGDVMPAACCSFACLYAMHVCTFMRAMHHMPSHACILLSATHSCFCMSGSVWMPSCVNSHCSCMLCTDRRECTCWWHEYGTGTRDGAQKNRQKSTKTVIVSDSRNRLACNMQGNSIQGGTMLRKQASLMLSCIQPQVYETCPILLWIL